MYSASAPADALRLQTEVMSLVSEINFIGISQNNRRRSLNLKKFQKSKNQSI